MRSKGERAQRLSAQRQTVERGVCFNARVIQCSRTGNAKAQRAGRLRVFAVQQLNLGNVNSGALGVDLKMAGFEVKTPRSGEAARRQRSIDRGESKLIFGQRALDTHPSYRLAVGCGVVELNPSRAARRAQRPISLELRIERAAQGQLFSGHWQQVVE